MRHSQLLHGIEGSILKRFFFAMYRLIRVMKRTWNWGEMIRSIGKIKH